MYFNYFKTVKIDVCISNRRQKARDQQVINDTFLQVYHWKQILVFFLSAFHYKQHTYICKGNICKIFVTSVTLVCSLFVQNCNFWGVFYLNTDYAHFNFVRYIEIKFSIVL